MSTNVKNVVKDTQKQKTRKANGEGSVYQLASGRWTGKLQRGKKPDGKANRKTFSGNTEAEVRRKIRAYIKELDRYSPENISNMSVQEYVENWLYNVKFYELKPKSFDRLEDTVKGYVIPHLGYLQLANVQMEDIRAMLNAMNNKKLSYSSIKKGYDACNAIFKYALIKDLERSPMMGVKMIPTNKIKYKGRNSKKSISQGKTYISKKPYIARKAVEKYFTEEEVKLIEEEATRVNNSGGMVYKRGYIFILMANTGIRVGEALGILKNRNIDLENNALYISGNVVTVRMRDERDPSVILGIENKLQDSTKTVAGDDRKLPLNKKAKHAIEQLLSQSIMGSELLISNDMGMPLSNDTINATFKRILRAIGIDDEGRGTHTLRHSFASRLFKKGVDIKKISKLLGHSTVGITYDTYIHLIKEQEVDAVMLLDDDLDIDIESILGDD